MREMNLASQYFVAVQSVIAPHSFLHRASSCFAWGLPLFTPSCASQPAQANARNEFSEMNLASQLACFVAVQSVIAPHSFLHRASSCFAWGLPLFTPSCASQPALACARNEFSFTILRCGSVRYCSHSFLHRASSCFAWGLPLFTPSCASQPALACARNEFSFTILRCGSVRYCST
jgi:hypothetical protein